MCKAILVQLIVICCFPLISARQWRDTPANTASRQRWRAIVSEHRVNLPRARQVST
jgi:hypothetical protein